MQYRASRLHREFILGGQRSGKSRCDELCAQRWLAQLNHSAMLLVTALTGDDEMRERIAQSVAAVRKRVTLMSSVPKWP